MLRSLFALLMLPLLALELQSLLSQDHRFLLISLLALDSLLTVY